MLLHSDHMLLHAVTLQPSPSVRLSRAFECFGTLLGLFWKPSVLGYYEHSNKRFRIRVYERPMGCSYINGHSWQYCDSRPASCAVGLPTRTINGTILQGQPVRENAFMKKPSGNVLMYLNWLSCATVSSIWCAHCVKWFGAVLSFGKICVTV